VRILFCSLTPRPGPQEKAEGERRKGLGRTRESVELTELILDARTARRQYGRSPRTRMRYSMLCWLWS
jgi:hypothetical protein